MRNNRGVSTIIWVIIALILGLVAIILFNGGISKTWIGISDFFKKNNVASVQTICIERCKSDEYTYCEEEIELRLKRGETFTATCNTFSRIPGNDKNELGGLIAICPNAYCFEESYSSNVPKKEENQICILDSECLSSWCYNYKCRSLDNKLDNGDTCTKSQQCESAFCDPKDFTCKKKPEPEKISEVPSFLTKGGELESWYENSAAGETTTLKLKKLSTGTLTWVEFFVTTQIGLEGEEEKLKDETIILPADFSTILETKEVAAPVIEIEYELPAEVGKWVIFNFYVKDTQGKWYKIKNSLITLSSASENSETLQDSEIISSIMKQIRNKEITLKTLVYDKTSSSWKEVEKSCSCELDDSSDKSCKKYADAIILSAHTYDLDKPLLLLAIMIQESGCNADATGSSGEIGLMQINSRLHISSYEAQHGALTPIGNIMIGAQILKEKYDEYKDGVLFSDTYKNNTVFKENIDSCLKDGYVRYKYYKGWNAALRGYNGWGCKTNDKYVEEVNYLYGKLREFYINELVK